MKVVGSAGNPSSWLKASCCTYAALLMGAVVESLCMSLSTGHLPGWNIQYHIGKFVLTLFRGSWCEAPVRIDVGGNM